MQIVQAKISDAALIRQIAEIVWPVAYAHILSAPQLNYMLNKFYSLDALSEQMLTNGHQFFMAKDENLSVGFASVSKEDEAVFKLQKLYVLPHCQGKNIGTALLQKVIDYSASNNGKSLILNVNRHNKARYYYEKQGFKIMKEVDIEIGQDYWMNDFVMQRNL
jgi:ribosomal protein S18 acetylase RimI-like enzyme